MGSEPLDEAVHILVFFVVFCLFVCVCVLIVVRVEAVCVALTFHAQRLQSPQGRAEQSLVVLVSI